MHPAPYGVEYERVVDVDLLTRCSFRLVFVEAYFVDDVEEEGFSEEFDVCLGGVV